jgi:hypothetical protein
MHRETGEIREESQIQSESADCRENWLPIYKLPDKDCVACSGHGYVGFFPNSKVIPCVCVFYEECVFHIADWSRAIQTQIKEPRASKDALRKLLGGN